MCLNKLAICENINKLAKCDTFTSYVLRLQYIPHIYMLSLYSTLSFHDKCYNIIFGVCHELVLYYIILLFSLCVQISAFKFLKTDFFSSFDFFGKFFKPTEQKLFTTHNIITQPLKN